MQRFLEMYFPIHPSSQQCMDKKYVVAITLKKYLASVFFGILRFFIILIMQKDFWHNLFSLLHNQIWIFLSRGAPRKIWWALTTVLWGYIWQYVFSIFNQLWNKILCEKCITRTRSYLPFQFLTRASNIQPCQREWSRII